MDAGSQRDYRMSLSAKKILTFDRYKLSIELLRPFKCTRSVGRKLKRLNVEFLPRDARSAKRGIAIVGRPSVRPSVCL